MTMANNKIDLIYIASTGRSGSTLLESILGAHSQMATAGEIHVWSRNIIEGGSIPCGCGKPVPECSFWQQMERRVEPLQQPKPQIDFFRDKYNAGKTLRLSRLPEFFLDRQSASLQQQIDIYGQNNQQFFTAFNELIESEKGTKPTWIVDSSKDPYRLLWLLNSGLFNIKVLQVVKDPRAFVYSMSKDLLKQNRAGIKVQLLHRTVMKSLSWIVQNSLFKQIANKYVDSADYIFVPYEKLASAPQQTLREICTTIGCEYEEQAIANFRNNNMHTIAGNPMRFREGGIVLDETWKLSLPTKYRKLTEMITGNIYQFISS